MSDSEKIFEPKPQDVQSGRGAGARKNPGNLRYNSLLHENYNDYVNARKGYKKDVLKRIIASIQDEGGRFLDKRNETDNFWIVMNKDKVFAKVSQGIRDLRVTGQPPVFKQHTKPKAKKVAQKSEQTALKNGVGREGRFDPKKSVILQRKFPDNGTLPGQPRRLSFAERVKLLQQEQMRAMGGNSDDESHDSDGDEADEEASEAEESENGDDDEKEPEKVDEADENKSGDKPSSIQMEASEAANCGPKDAPDDVSETETEDSFPTHRRDSQTGESNENDSDKEL